MSSLGQSSPGPSTSRVVLIGSLSNVVCSLPLFLVGSMAVQLREELVFSAVGLGATVSLFRLTQAATATPLGKLVDRFGATRALWVAILTIQIVSIGIAVSANSWVALTVWLCIGSAGKALVQPAANRLIVRHVPAGRQGTAVGFKQAAAPIATILAGLSVPFIAVTVGWRWAFVLVAVLGGLVVAFIGKPQPGAPLRSRRALVQQPLEARSVVAMLAVAFGMGNAASAAVPAFWVDFAVTSGSSPEVAGFVLAISGAAAIASRLVSGMSCDRLRSGHIFLCSGLLFIGAIGLSILAFAPVPMQAVGVILAQAGAWGFSAALWFTVLRAYRKSPGRITGVLAVGSLIGASAGPLAFGLLVETASYSIAWMVAAILAMFAALGMAFTAPRMPGLAG